MLDFLALGNLTLDDVVTSEGRIAPNQLGGNGAYAAAGMRLWGERVGLVGVVGSDFPQQWLDALSEAGVDISGVARLDTPHQLRSRVFYFPDGRRTDVVAEARAMLPAAAATLLDLETEYTAMGSPFHRRMWPIFSPNPQLLGINQLGARYAHLSPGPVANNRANAAALKARSGGAIRLTLDWPWWDWDQEASADAELLRHIDYLLPSQEEFDIHARALAGRPPDTVARGLLAQGPQAIVIKQGSRGARLLAKGASRWQTIPVYPAQVVDPTGAGDSFCGGFLVGLARTQDPLQAALYGAVSASFLIEDFGVLHSLAVTPAQAETRLTELRQRADVRV